MFLIPTPTMKNKAHLVRHIETANFGGKTLRIGDLNSDGAPDLLLAQSIYGTREITCLTALTIGGEVLWQRGEASLENGRGYSDLPVQTYDWDGDGRNEVLFVRQAKYLEVENPELWHRERALRYADNATLIVLDGATGEEKTSFPLPAPADDSLLFADLTGRGRRQDLVVKDRYWNMWGVSHEGRVLWHWEGSTGHYPAIADVDGDGCDEVFVGYALLDHDGRVLWSYDAGPEHSDANAIVQLPSGEWRLLFGNGGVHCLDVQGRELWHQKVFEAQHLVTGCFGPNLSPLQFMVIDRGNCRTPRVGQATLLHYDIDGRELWRKPLPPGSWCAICSEIDWSGHGEARELVLCTRDPIHPVTIYNGAGEIVQEFGVTPDAHDISFDTEGRPDTNRNQLVLAADVWGDGREEVLIYDTHTIDIYANTRVLARPRDYNATLYRGM
jgi:hypothetical protein